MAAPAFCEDPIAFSEPARPHVRPDPLKAVPKGSVFGHKVVHIPGHGRFIDSCRIDSSGTKNVVLFPYKHCLTLQKVQYIIVAILAAIAVAAIATALIMTGTAGIFGGIAVALLIGGGIAGGGYAAVRFGNRNDPTVLDDQRRHLFKHMILDPNRKHLTTEAEDNELYSQTRQFDQDPDLAADYFEGLPRANEDHGQDGNLKSLREAGATLQLLKHARSIAIAPALQQARLEEHQARARQAELQRAGLITQAAGMGGMLLGAVAGDNGFGNAMGTLGALTGVAGVGTELAGEIRYAGDQRGIDARLKMAIRRAEDSIQYHPRRNQVFVAIVQPLRGGLQAFAATQVRDVSHTLMNAQLTQAMQ